MRRTPLPMRIVLSAILASACTGSPQPAVTTEPEVEPSVEVIATPSLTADPPGSASPGPTTGPPATVRPTDTPATVLPTESPATAGEPFFGAFEEVVVLLTPTAGGGTRPLLEWQAVEGADEYGMYLYAPDDRIYWGWRDAATAVHVGGEPQLRDGAAGPRVTAGMSWVVVAYDADGLPVAVSELRPISP
jgi:hypothetical protein